MSFPPTPLLTPKAPSGGKRVSFSLDSDSDEDLGTSSDSDPDKMRITPNARNSTSLRVRRRNQAPKLKPYSIDLQDGEVTVTPDMNVWEKRKAYYRNAIHKIRDIPVDWRENNTELDVVDNIGMALVSASATPAEREIADRRHRRLRRQAMRKAREKNRDEDGKMPPRGDDDPETESDEESLSEEGEGTPTPGEKSKKRKRGEKSPSPPGNGEGGRQGGGATTLPTPRPIPPSTQNQLLPLFDPPFVRPQPLRISYKRHELGDRSDAWFIEQFRLLYREAEQFVSDYYCVHDLKKGKFYEPWALDHTPEFIYWAEQVAEPDPKTGWDSLLRDTNERKWLIMGVIVRILRTKIFDEELFGTDEREGELMHAVEKTFFLSEGFQRTELRAKVARSIIGESSVTSNFYPQVARLTARIWLLLKPLTDYLYSIPPPIGTKLPLAEDLYQQLHNLVSRAAYLSLCVRLSPTIFYIVDTLPGSVYEPDDVHSLEAQTYTVSKERILSSHAHKLASWQARKDAAKAELEAITAQGRKVTNATRNLAKIDNERPVPPGQVYRALTKIAVWPTVTRFKPGSQEEEDEEETFGIEKELWEKDGMRLFQICKGAVVCYYGKADRSEKKKRLRVHVKEKNDRFGYGRGMGTAGKLVTTAVTAAAVYGLGLAFSNAGSLEGMFQFVGA